MISAKHNIRILSIVSNNTHPCERTVTPMEPFFPGGIYFSCNTEEGHILSTNSENIRRLLNAILIGEIPDDEVVLQYYFDIDPRTEVGRRRQWLLFRALRRNPHWINALLYMRKGESRHPLLRYTSIFRKIDGNNGVWEQWMQCLRGIKVLPMQHRIGENPELSVNAAMNRLCALANDYVDGEARASLPIPIHT